MKNTVATCFCVGLAVLFNCAKEKAADQKDTHVSGISKQDVGTAKNEIEPRIPYETKCVDGKCSTFVLLENSNKMFAGEYTKEPSCKLVSRNLLEILTSCGSPCNYSVFIDLASGRRSIPFFMALALDTLHEFVAFCDTNDIKIAAIFDTSRTPIAVDRPYARSATMSTVVDSATFRENGIFVFHYYSGRDFVGIWDSLKVTF
jgi:hypothetical protein